MVQEKHGDVILSIERVQNMIRASFGRELYVRKRARGGGGARVFST